MNSYRPDTIIPKGYERELHIHDKANERWIGRLSQELQKIPTLLSPKDAPIEFLDSIAYATSNDIYFIQQNLTEEEKRRLLEVWITVHRKRGTIWAIEKILEALSLNSEVVEWFNYGGVPYRFKIVIKQDSIIDEEKIKLIFYAIEKYKNVKSILDYIDIVVEMVEVREIHTSTIQELSTPSYKREIREVAEVHCSTIQTLPESTYKRVVRDNKKEIHTSTIQELSKSEYKRVIKDDRKEIYSSSIQELPKSFYKRRVNEFRELYSSTIQELSKSKYKRVIKDDKRETKGAVVWQI